MPLDRLADIERSRERRDAEDLHQSPPERAPQGWEDELNAAWAEVNKARRQLEGAVDLIERMLASFDDYTIEIPDVANAAIAEMRTFIASAGGR